MIYTKIMDKMKIKFYGTIWCSDCIRSKQYLDENQVGYEFIDIATNSEAVAEVEKINKGLQSIPTILFPDGEVLVEPTNEELKKALEANKNLIIVHKAQMDKKKEGDDIG